MVTRILGLDRLRRKLREIPKQAQVEIAKAMEEGAEEIVAMARSLVAVDEGTLRDSIGWTWGEAPQGSIVLGRVKGRRGRSSSNMRITIFAGNREAFYARWREFGTAPHVNAGLYPGTQHPGTPARPFFFVAYRANRKRVRGRVSRAVGKAARKVAGK